MRYLALAAIVLANLFRSAGVDAKDLEILYHDRPPYYAQQDDGEVAGIVATPINKSLRAAGIPFRWVSRSGNAQIKIVKRGKDFACAAGWFKNPEREKFANYSLPIYRDKPQVIVMRTDNEKAMQHSTLRELFNDPSLKFGAKLGYSYGGFVDGLIAELNPKVMRNTQDSGGMVRMLLGRRFDYFIAAPEEFASLTVRLGIAGEDIMSIRMKDIPPGNRRYLMCSKAVPKELIRRFDEALEKSSE